MVLFRRLLGDVLRDRRARRGLTLRELSKSAGVSLGYISEIERGQKEASSELLASLCAALDASLASVLREVSDAIAVEEAAAALDAGLTLETRTIPVVGQGTARSGDVVASAA